jgi:G3E family GTPase
MSGELVYTLQKIEKNIDPEYVIMEATGVANPDGIRETLEEGYQSKLPIKMCCLADAGRWKRMLKPLGHIIQAQLDGAHLILINKVDLVTPEVLKEVDDSVRSFNNSAEIFHISALKPIDTEIWAKLA